MKSKLENSDKENESLKTQIEKITLFSQQKSEELIKINEKNESYKKIIDDRIQEENSKKELEKRVSDEVYNKYRRNIYGMSYMNVSR